ncbi:hypothetical protein [Pararhodonellum marinum]|uniref:hypothetical protein n=1 Tax=Pararhodonellum marinum TaxID=2755358 RepID=UPI00188ED3E1|nr:hypothetical protein [Pararhodonellum marinum]
MKIFSGILILMVSFSFQVFSQEKEYFESQQVSLIMYPKIYQIIELEDCMETGSSLFKEFLAKNQVDWLETEEGFIMMKIYEDTYQYEKTELIKGLEPMLGPEIRIKSVKAYGWEYLPYNYKRDFKIQPI